MLFGDDFDLFLLDGRALNALWLLHERSIRALVV
jgi:hypothetical protein